jgi:tetratricopeptide (TPR) repeat protein
MVAATRRHDRLAVQIDPDLPAIIEELAAGRPVLVLQNLGIGWLPVWHYAVVVGYRPDADSFVLRSGTTERLTMRRSRFARSWERADNWAVVILEPGELPQSRDPAAFIRAVAGLESVGRLDAALLAYRSGLTRWPASDLLLLGYGNSLYGSGEIARAARVYRDLLAISPNHLPALNNLAHAMGELGCREEALAIIARAPDSADPSFKQTLTETRQTLESRSPGRCARNVSMAEST